MIKRELTPQILDQYLGIASWVDSKIAPPKKPKASQMFNLIRSYRIKQTIINMVNLTLKSFQHLSSYKFMS